MKKPRMTKQRLAILERLNASALAWGYGDQGRKGYFFTDGGSVSANVVEGMLRTGLLKHASSPLGVGQEIIPA